MKIKCKKLTYQEVLKLQTPAHRPPVRQTPFFRKLLQVVSAGELKEVGFSYEKKGMERLNKGQPALYLMNHSCFLDLKIAATLLRHQCYHIICTSDGFVGKNWLMRHLGCIPAQKFVMDTTMVRDMIYASGKLNSSILMYPEASYTFDGTATPLPTSLGKCMKLLKLPVVMIRTYGAFSHDPLYNMLQPRRAKVSATMEYLLSPEEIVEKSPEELQEIVNEQFRFDGFRWQQENGIKINETFRTDGLNRVLYKCPKCYAEGQMEGKGVHLRCHHCGKIWQLDEFGYLRGEDGEDIFVHVPDWYAWERACVREEIEQGTYQLDIPVTIRMMVNTKCIYEIGKGRLRHGTDGFCLTGAEDELQFSLPPHQSYSLYADYFWYELGDMICIGDQKTLYYCFPTEGGDVVAKTRLATEELYKLHKSGVRT
ncbi:MAG: 1-acyl-sn-glycerol-3-phosphate acyltransferase [Eubacteriales bacterium]|nr:1-acyl-sn-glycerol-3-phosphate acyltransferase [Eubacteriales bacterium]